MKTPEEIKKGLETCAKGYEPCSGNCTYEESHGSAPKCMIALKEDALALIEQLEEREWELFSLLSSAFYGKQCYFKQDDGTVYSRATCEYLSFDQAVDEFAKALTYAGEAQSGTDMNVPRWISVNDDEKPVHGKEYFCVCTLPDDPKHEWDWISVLRWFGDGGNDYVNRPHFTNEGVEGMTVTHWMPLSALPEPPKEG